MVYVISVFLNKHYCMSNKGSLRTQKFQKTFIRICPIIANNSVKIPSIRKEYQTWKRKTLDCFFFNYKTRRLNLSLYFVHLHNRTTYRNSWNTMQFLMRKFHALIWIFFFSLTSPQLLDRIRCDHALTPCKSASIPIKFYLNLSSSFPRQSTTPIVNSENRALSLEQV